ASAETRLGPVGTEVAHAFESACTALGEMGHGVETIDLDPGAMLLDCARALICVGIAAIPITNMEWVDPVVREMFREGHKLTAAEYVNLVAVMHNTARTIVEPLHPPPAPPPPTLTPP